MNRRQEHLKLSIGTLNALALAIFGIALVVPVINPPATATMAGTLMEPSIEGAKLLSGKIDKPAFLIYLSFINWMVVFLALVLHLIAHLLIRFLPNEK